MQDCFVCSKHRSLNDFTGEAIAEQGSLLLTHFPKVENERTTKGHLLIEPRRHITDLAEMNEEESMALGVLIRAAVLCMKQVLGAEHVYLFRINDLVPHLHFHLVPRYAHTPKEHRGVKILQWPDREILSSLSEIRGISAELRARYR